MLHNFFKTGSIFGGSSADKFAKGGGIGDSDINTAFDSYLEAALWSSGEEGEFDGYTIYDFDSDTKQKMRTVVEKWMASNADAIKKSGLSFDQIGHDLWLTRNRHGAGFFDRGLEKEIEDKLEASAQALGECNLYAESGKVFVDGKYENGGGVELGKHVDLFENYEKIPQRVKGILEKYWGEFGDSMDYSDTKNMLDEVEAEGYTFDYYLDNEPYGLRPIGVELSQVEGYEEEYKNGGKMPAFKSKKHKND